MSQPLISIIVPIYNVENYIEECLQSIVVQTYFNFEAILINDGSTDSSVTKCDVFIQQHPHKFKLIHKENGGLSDTRNVGISHAKGEYLIFLDSDDYLSPLMLENLMGSALKNNADITCCGITEVTEVGKRIRGIPANSVLKEGHYKLSSEPFIFAHSLPNACNKLFKTSLFKNNKIAFPVGLWYEDLATIPKLFYFANNINIINDELYFYRYREGSITKTYSLKIMDIYVILQMLKDFYSASKPELEDVTKTINTLYVNHTVIALSRLVLVNANKRPALAKIARELNTTVPNISTLMSQTFSPLKYKMLIILLKTCGVTVTYFIIKMLVKTGKIKP